MHPSRDPRHAASILPCCYSGRGFPRYPVHPFAKTGVVSGNGISSLPGKYDPEVLLTILREPKLLVSLVSSPSSQVRVPLQQPSSAVHLLVTSPVTAPVLPVRVRVMPLQPLRLVSLLLLLVNDPDRQLYVWKWTAPSNAQDITLRTNSYSIYPSYYGGKQAYTYWWLSWSSASIWRQ